MIVKSHKRNIINEEFHLIPLRIKNYNEMKIIINYVIQGENNHWYNSELVNLDVVRPLYSPLPHKHIIEQEINK